MNENLWKSQTHRTTKSSFIFCLSEKFLFCFFLKRYFCWVKISIIIFFQLLCFKDVAPLFSCLHYFQQVMCCCFCFTAHNIFLGWLLFIFSSYYFITNLTILCLGACFFTFLVFEFVEHCGYVFKVFIKFRMCSVTISSKNILLSTWWLRW